MSKEKHFEIDGIVYDASESMDDYIVEVTGRLNAQFNGQFTVVASSVGNIICKIRLSSKAVFQLLRNDDDKFTVASSLGGEPMLYFSSDIEGRKALYIYLRTLFAITNEFKEVIGMNLGVHKDMIKFDEIIMNFHIATVEKYNGQSNGKKDISYPSMLLLTKYGDIDLLDLVHEGIVRLNLLNSNYTLTYTY